MLMGLPAWFAYSPLVLQALGAGFLTWVSLRAVAWLRSDSRARLQQAEAHLPEPK
jgi:hypothetical protein